MADGAQPKARRNPCESPIMILQIDRGGGEAPLQFAAVIRNLGAGQATLEVTNPWTIVDWETLKGRKGRLRLLSDGTGKTIEIPGIVTWARYTVQDQENGHLDLGLELTDPDRLVHQLLFEQITHTSEDIKGLWDRWEQTRQTSEAGPFSTKLGFAATTLLIGALAMQFVDAQGFKMFGWVLWVCGTLLVGNQVLRFWKHCKTSD